MRPAQELEKRISVFAAAFPNRSCARAVVPVAVVLAVFLAGCASDAKRRPVLTYFAAVDAETDARFALITQFTPDSCSVIAYDHGIHKVARLSPSSREAVFHGSYGDGPGEFRHVRGIVRGHSGQVLLEDWVRRRWVRIQLPSGRSDGAAAPDDLTRYGLVGKIRMLPDGSLVDYWLADGMTNVPISANAIAERPLVAHLDSANRRMAGGWGQSELPAQPNTAFLHLALQAGDVDVLGDTLYVLRSPLGRLELFSVSRPSPQPIRMIQLAPHFKRPQWREVRMMEPYDSTVTVVAVAPPIAAAMAVSPNGTIVVIAYTTDGSKGIGPEQLDVYAPGGQRIASYPLAVRQTRSASVLADGTVVLLTNANADSLTSRSILFFDVAEARFAGAPRCGWRRSPWAVTR